MNVVIIEDERLAGDHLEMMIKRAFPEAEIAARLASVKDSIIYFLRNQDVDFVFMDIQLSDGLSFEIIDAVKIEAPIIFTTAYDEYAIKAFQVNSIAYLLKPVDQTDIEGAISKAKALGISSVSLQNVSETLSNGYKERFLLKIGEHIRTIPSKDILRFYSKEKINFLVSEDGRHLPLDMTIDDLERKLDPGLFFRINRSNIININGIKDIISYTNSRLKVVLESGDMNNEELIVARERVSGFKQWLDR